LEEIYVNVALPIPRFSLFTYKIPLELYENLENKELIGRRVLAPFRNYGLTGIIVEKFEKEHLKDNIEIKEISSIPDKRALACFEIFDIPFKVKMLAL